LLIHISPGTPAMQTLWLLLAKCGFIEQPFKVVKSYRKHERGNRAAVVEVSLGLESFYKVYRASRPAQQSSPETAAIWEPSRFRSSRLKALFDEARRYARLKVPVLILGERGTGKTTLASWLRSHSPFRREALDHRWPSVACGQFSGDTIKSELFGHKAGSFTGATSDQEGLLSVAHGDTLLLDEVGDISRDGSQLITGMVPLQRLMTPPAGAHIAEWYLQGGGLRRRLHLLARLAERTRTPPPVTPSSPRACATRSWGSSTPTTSTPPAARALPPSTRPAMAHPSPSAAMAPSTPSPMPMPSRCSSSRR
jgi:hypothetical protein